MSDTICAACRKPKNSLVAKRSKLRPEIILLMCDTCIKMRMEPRGIVMLVGREQGAEAIKDFIRPKRYHGDPILVEDLF